MSKCLTEYLTYSLQRFNIGISGVFERQLFGFATFTFSSYLVVLAFNKDISATLFYTNQKNNSTVNHLIRRKF